MIYLNYITWQELQTITKKILDKFFDQLDYYPHLDWSTTTYSFNSCYEPYDMPYDTGIEWQWAKEKSLGWLQKSWLMLNEEGLTQYFDKYQKSQVYILYFSLIVFYLDQVQYCRFYFEKNFFNLLSLLNIEKNIFIINSNHFDDELDFDLLWNLIIKNINLVAFTLKTKFGNQYKITTSIDRSLQLELDEDFIYFSLEEFYCDEYYLDREQVELRLKNTKTQTTGKKYHYFLNLSIVKDPIQEVIELFEGTIWEFKELDKNKIDDQYKHIETYNLNYKLEKYANQISIECSIFKAWIHTLKRKKNIIFSGSPGTGKTFIAENLANYLISNGNGFYELIQFHSGYTYEDFIQGICPQTKENGLLEYNLVPGRFIEFCRKAETYENECVLIIDEINRANLSNVFGELMYLLEYRNKEICLAGSQNKFKIPNNVYIIGTMNTADKSISLVDFALRRRFAFIKILPNYEVIKKFHLKNYTNFNADGLINVLKKLNEAINDDNYLIGISFFLTNNLANDIENIWVMEIEPYLEEYFLDRSEHIDKFRWKKVEQEILDY